MARGAKVGRKKKTAPLLDWTIMARIRPDRVELVRVPIAPGPHAAGEERVLEVKRGRRLSKKGPLGHLGIVSDTSGQRALQAFRLAVRKAKSE